MPEVAYREISKMYIQKDNLIKLKQIASLKNNWDGYGAQPISPHTLRSAQRLICALHEQPEIFPTAAGSIQIEYEKDNGDYLEFQFTGEGSCEVFRSIDSNEEYFTLPDTPTAINLLVDNFYGYSL